MKLKISLALFLGATTLFADQALITKSKKLWFGAYSIG